MSDFYFDPQTREYHVGVDYSPTEGDRARLREATLDKWAMRYCFGVGMFLWGVAISSLAFGVKVHGPLLWVSVALLAVAVAWPVSATWLSEHCRWIPEDDS